MRIAFLSNGLHPYKVGGMQKHTVNLVNNMPEFGWEVDLYYCPDENYPDAESIAKQQFDGREGVRLLPVAKGKRSRFPGHYFFDSYRTSARFRKAILEAAAGYEFIYAQGYMGWACIAARKSAGSGLPPVGVNPHGLETLQAREGIAHAIRSRMGPTWQRWNLRHADCVLSLGGALDELIAAQNVPRESIIRSTNGIAASWFVEQPRISTRARRFLFVGRNETRKGFAELSLVMPEILRSTDAEFHFVGDIPKSLRIQSDRIEYHGVIRSESELQKIYSACDILLCPSHSEGLPTVILEASACGLPAIGTDVGAVRLLVDEETGWLIPSRDSQSLERAIRESMSSNIVARAHAAQGRARSFQWKTVAEHTVTGVKEFLRRYDAPQSS